MNNLEDFLKVLLKDLSSLPEERMQFTLLCERFSCLEPDEVAKVLDLLYRKGIHDETARRAQSILVSPENLEEILGKERFKRTYLASLDLKLKRVSRLFTNLPPHKSGFYGYDKEEEAKMEFISLGQRRSMAKGFVKDILDRLLSDPDPMVIGNLLNNPRITEREVVKIASKRPNSPVILKLLAEHRKWSRRYNVIKAVVQNPYTPPRISIGLMGFLLTQDLRIIAKDKTLHPQVKSSAEDILDERGLL